MIDNDTWKLVEGPSDGKIIGSRIVLRNKYNPDGILSRRKARLVAQGFSQRPGVDFVDTFAPVARMESFRLFMALSTKFELKISQLDVETAYLHGDIDTEIFMKKPDLLEEALIRIIDTDKKGKIVEKADHMLKDLRSGKKVCKLQKAIYGLRQAGRQWHIKLHKTLKSLKLKSTESDPCLYVDIGKNHRTYVLVYVDDILIASSDPERVTEIKKGLSAHFKIKDNGKVDYCLGIQIEQDDNKISLSQSGYIKDVLEKFNISQCKPVKTPLVADKYHLVQRQSICSKARVQSSFSLKIQAHRHKISLYSERAPESSFKIGIFIKRRDAVRHSH